MITRTIPLEERYRLMADPRVTLDGRPACILGAKLDFAHVATLDPDGPDFEFAWPTVKNIIENNNARFNS